MDKDLQDLLAAWLDHEELTEARRAELLRRLGEDESFRTEFVAEIHMLGMTRSAQTGEPRWLVLEDLLAVESKATVAFEERVAVEISQFDRNPFVPIWMRWLAGAMAAVAIWFGTMMIAYQAGQNQFQTVSTLPAAKENTPGLVEAAPVAVLSKSVNAKWGDAVTAPQNGAVLRPGPLQINDGLAQVDFVGGAQVIVRGPAELDLRSAAELRLLSGSATVRVSEQAQGFRLTAPGVEVFDGMGTYGLTVTADGQPELHAMGGRVSIRDEAGTMKELVESTAIKLANRAFQPVSYQPEVFPDLKELRRLEQQVVANRSVNWYDQSLRWSAEPETLLHFTFLEDVYQEDRVNNHARQADNMSHGIVIGGRWTEGRWPWKKALEFRKRTDRVLLGLPGKHAQLTLATWIRVDAFTRSKNVLLRSKQPERGSVNGDGQVHDHPQHLPGRGEIRWELDNTGVVSFKVATGAESSAERWDIAATPRVLKDDQMGQWALLATTYDSKTGAVVHYWNGRPVSKSIMTDAAPLAFEFLELGNPNLSDAELKEGERYGFFGAMDELLISRRLLNAAEIAEFFLAGKPAS